MRVETLGKEALINCAKTAMSSKIVGAESEFFSQLVVDAVTSVKTEPRGKLLTLSIQPHMHSSCHPNAAPLLFSAQGKQHPLCVTKQPPCQDCLSSQQVFQYFS